jgi:hypothetical protein
MKPPSKVQLKLNQTFQKVQEAPTGFGLFVAVHDFVEHIESYPAFSKTVATYAKANAELNIPKKYAYLKQVYQGVEDIDGKPGGDIGHTRYSVIRELTSIRNKDVSESNSFWKKREALRKMVGEIHRTLVV